MKFYRYITVEHASIDMDGEMADSEFANPKLVLEEYELHKETPKGYWIGYGLPSSSTFYSISKWVSKTSKKRFAYPTKEEALNGFIKRTERRIKILKRQLDVCKLGMSLAQNEISKK